MRLSIGWRLTLWNMVTLAVALVGMGALVYGLMRQTLYQRIDRALRTELEELEQDARLGAEPEARLRHWVYEFKEHENVSCVVYHPDGRVFLRTEELAEASVPPAPPVGPGEQRFANTSLAYIGRQRTLASSLNAGASHYLVLLLAPLEDTDRSLGQLLTVLATAIPICLLAGGGLAFLQARRALAPMEQLHRLTQEITADRLDRRLPVVVADDELGRLTQTINAMISRLEHSFAEIRRFTADASHELRTPLTAIRSEAEVALHRPLALADQQQLLGSVLEECERLTRLTDQLLALSREDAGLCQPLREKVELGSLVHNAVETMRPAALAKGLELRDVRNRQVFVMGDEARLRQVFYNLLDNAIKYTPDGGNIDVNVGQDSDRAIVTVQDTGIGIPPEHIPAVFDRFYRVDKARSREQGGTGLGLSIARSIIQAHNGQIELESGPGQGTTFTVILPIKNPD
jgi:heavy metal sensor kinase